MLTHLLQYDKLVTKPQTRQQEWWEERRREKIHSFHSAKFVQSCATFLWSCVTIVSLCLCMFLLLLVQYADCSAFFLYLYVFFFEVGGGLQRNYAEGIQIASSGPWLSHITCVTLNEWTAWEHETELSHPSPLRADSELVMVQMLKSFLCVLLSGTFPQPEDFMQIHSWQSILMWFW